MIIRLAKDDDIKRVVEIVNACADHMISKNIFQWDENYPNKEIFDEDIKNDCLFVLENNTKVLGCICISL